LEKKPIISVFNLKNGVGCSSLTWNIAHTLDLDIYQHEKAMHHLFMKERLDSVEYTRLYENNIDVEFINKRFFKSGIYDLGSNVNYAYIRQILEKSDVIIIPCELGYEVMLKTIASIKYAQQINDRCMIYVVFNKLDKSDPDREKRYTEEAEKFVAMNVDISNLEFLYMRYSFAMFRELSYGFYFLDNYIYQKEEFPPITPFQLLRNLRRYTLQKMKYNSKRKKKGTNEIEKSKFYDNHERFYTEYLLKIIQLNKDKQSDYIAFDEESDVEESDVEKAERLFSEIYKLSFNDNNRKLVKDMLILTTKVKGTYSLVWENNND